MFQWQGALRAAKGVICGCEQSQEWLLPWWWSRYKECNTLPVTFFDFGMTDEMVAWCRERGDVIAMPIDSSFVAPRSAIEKEMGDHWESFYGWTMWNSRLTWFKKPFAFLSSPYEKSLWVDLDCEVLGSLDPLFSQCDDTSQLALVRDYATDHLPQLDPGVLYNGGVVAFQHGAPIIEKWARAAYTETHRFWGDDPLLSHLIYHEKLEVVELPETYNWRLVRGFNLNAVILHWVGSGGKSYIRAHGGLKPALDAFYQGCRGKVTQV
jgi:hypothetical protein